MDESHFTRSADGHPDQLQAGAAVASSALSFEQPDEPEKATAGNTTTSKKLHLGLTKKSSKADADPPPQSPNTLLVPIGIKVSPATPELEPEVQRQLEKVERARSVESLLEPPELRESAGECLH